MQVVHCWTLMRLTRSKQGKNDRLNYRNNTTALKITVKKKYCFLKKL